MLRSVRLWIESILTRTKHREGGADELGPFEALFNRGPGGSISRREGGVGWYLVLLNLHEDGPEAVRQVRHCIASSNEPKEDVARLLAAETQWRYHLVGCVAALAMSPPPPRSELQSLACRPSWAAPQTLVTLALLHGDDPTWQAPVTKAILRRKDSKAAAALIALSTSSDSGLVELAASDNEFGGRITASWLASIDQAFMDAKIDRPWHEVAQRLLDAQRKRSEAMVGMSEEELRRRIRLSLKLGALGDRLGSTMEGTPVDDRHVDWEIGGITDDTILTLATANGITDARGVDAIVIAHRFAEAFRSGIPGLGSSTYAALTALAEGQHWALSGLSGDRAAGNGAAMRIAPLALILDLSTESARAQLRDIARITHRNDEASVGALAFGLAIRHALDGATDRSETLAAIATQLPDTRVRDQIEQAASLHLMPAAAATKLGSSGYVAESVPLAIYLGFSSWPDAKTALETAALIADDSDTVASMVGQILGAAGQDVPNTDSLIDFELDQLAADLAAIPFRKAC